MVAQLGPRETRDVVARAQQPELLAAPPDEPEPVRGTGAGQRLRDLEDEGGSAPVVVQPGPAVDAVEVRTGDDKVRRVPRSALGDHVPCPPRLRDHVGAERHRDPGRPRRASVAERVADLDAGSQRRDRELWRAERRLEQRTPAGVALVHHDDGAGPSGDGVLHLLAEEAAPALEERNRAAREGREVRGLAATGGGVGGRAREEQVDGDDGRFDRAASGVEERAEVAVRAEAFRPRRAEDRRRAVDHQREPELLEADAVPRRAHALRDITRGCVVARRAGEAIPPVASGDPLQRDEVLADARKRDARRPLAALRRGRGGRRSDQHTCEERDRGDRDQPPAPGHVRQGTHGSRSLNAAGGNGRRPSRRAAPSRRAPSPDARGARPRDNPR